MPHADPRPVTTALPAFVALCGAAAWQQRVAELGDRVSPTSWRGRALGQRHALELMLARLCGPRSAAGVGPAERRVLAFANEAVRLAGTLPEGPRERLRALVVAGLQGEATLIPLFHLLRTAALHRARGFSVRFGGLAEDAPFDLLIEREGVAAEVVCETVSAEDGRPVRGGDWCALMDGLNPGLQAWLAAHPGRYLLKMTLPGGLSGPHALADLQARIMDLLRERRRQDAGPDVVLKLDPLVLAGTRGPEAGAAGLPAHLRAQFGPEAHLAVTTLGADPAGGSLFVMAARAGQGNAIAGAICRRMGLAAGSRLSGTRPGILSMFVEDVDRAEWRGLRERLELEGAARRFLTDPIARPVVAVACTSRAELFGVPAPDGAPDGELRFRNPAHPAAKLAALAPAVLSSV